LLYSRRAAAEALSLSIRSIDYLIMAQRLPMRRVGGKVMIPASAVRRFASEDHPERVRGDGRVVSIHSQSRRQISEAVPNRFGPESEPMDEAPLRRANGHR
jgi:hypothetical protein